MKCPACRSADVRDTGDRWHTSGNHYRLSKCLSCGTAFTAPMPDDDTLEAFYQNSFDYRWYRDHLGAKLRDSRIRVSEYRDLLGQRVLDFGGGLGYFSQAARAAGLHSITFDPYVPGARPEQDGWDSVVALHVLEHSNNPDRTVEQIKRYLAPAGRLIVAVPNYSSQGYETFGMRWVWAQPPLMHVFHFTAAGVRALLSRHGFTDLGVSYHERWDANLYCDLKMAERFRKWDAAWGARYVNAVPLFRRLVASINTRRRFAGLEKALAAYNPECENYAELQVTGVLPAA